MIFLSDIAGIGHVVWQSRMMDSSKRTNITARTSRSTRRAIANTNYCGGSCRAEGSARISRRLEYQPQLGSFLLDKSPTKVGTLNTACQSRRLLFVRLKLVECLYHKFSIQQIRQQRVGIVRAQFFGRMNTAGSDRQDARAEVPGTGDVVGGVADHDELFGFKLLAEMLVDSLRGDRRQIAPVKRFVAKGAGQLKEFRQPGNFHFQLRGRLDVAGE